MNTLFIAGTDTDAGKTVLTSALAAYYQTYYSQHSLAILKPLQTGSGDRELYLQLFNLKQTPAELNPLQFQAPLAPPLAAELEGRAIDLALPWRTLQSLQQTYDLVLVEGLGGLGSPVTRELTVADLARDWRLPTLLVVPVKLGAIGQAVANVALAHQCRIQLQGIVLSCVQPVSPTQIDQWAPADLIQDMTQIPVLGRLPHLDNPRDLNQLAQAAAQLDLEPLLPLPSGISAPSK